MNNKAFTLTELIAIIVVLASIFLVSFPYLINIIKSDDETIYDDMVKNLCLAGQSYIYNNIDSFEELSTTNSKIEITIEDLMEYGNVSNNLKNSKTGNSIDKDILIYTVLSDHSLDCKYIES